MKTEELTGLIIYKPDVKLPEGANQGEYYYDTTTGKYLKNPKYKDYLDGKNSFNEVEKYKLEQESKNCYNCTNACDGFSYCLACDNYNGKDGTMICYNFHSNWWMKEINNIRICEHFNKIEEIE